MSHAQSPRLAAGVFVDMHGGTETIAGLDAKTGKRLWEAPTKGDFAFGKGGGYYVGSHAVMTLQDGGRPEPVLLTTRNNVIRIRDGKVLGPIPFTHGSSGGPSVAFSGDIVYRVLCSDGTKTPMTAFRLTLAAASLKAEQLWETQKTTRTGYQGFVALPGHYLMPNPDAVANEAATGKTFGKGPDVVGMLPGTSNNVIGRTWIWLNGNSNGDSLHSSWGGRRWDGNALAIFQAADVSDPTAPRKLGRLWRRRGGRCLRLPKSIGLRQLAAWIRRSRPAGVRPGHQAVNRAGTHPADAGPGGSFRA